MGRAGPIDWELLKQRVAHTEDALARGSGADDERRHLALEAIALRLAAHRPSGAADAASVEFRVGARRYAVPIHAVREVVQGVQPTPVPGTPAFIAGIVHVHGRILAAVDLQAFLDGPGGRMAGVDTAVVVQGADMEFALLAADICAGPPMPMHPRGVLLSADDATRGARDACFALCNEDGLRLLDLDRLASHADFIVDHEVGA